LASSSEAALFLFLIERMRLSLSPHPQLSVIPRRIVEEAARLAPIPDRNPARVFNEGAKEVKDEGGIVLRGVKDFPDVFLRD